MRLSELIALLQDIQDHLRLRYEGRDEDRPSYRPSYRMRDGDWAEDWGPYLDPEVRLAIQPSWPFEYSIHSISCLEDLKGEDAPVVHLSEGVQLGYLPRAVQDVAW